MSRKTKSNPLSGGTIMRIVLGSAFVCLVGVGYLWQKREIHILGREIKGLEVQLDKLEKGNAALSRAYATMCSPAELDARVKRMGLGLQAPQPDQIVRLPEPVPESGRTDLALGVETQTNQ